MQIPEEHDIIDFESLFEDKKQPKPRTNPNMPWPKGFMMILTYFLIMGFVSSIALIIIQDYDHLTKNYNRYEAMLYHVDLNPYALGYLDVQTFEQYKDEYPEIAILYQDTQFVFFSHKENPYLESNYTFEMIKAMYETEGATWNTGRPAVPIEFYIYKYDGPFIVAYRFEMPENANYRQPVAFMTITTEASALLNFIVYVILAAAIIPFGFRSLELEFDYFSRPPKQIGVDIAKGYVYMILASIGATAIVSVIGYVFNYAQPISMNQQAIERALFSSNGILIVFMTVLFAPVLEELIFRKAMFGFFRNQWLALAVSSLIFGFIHVSQETTALAFITNLITYSASGVALGYVYIKNKNNVWASILVHAAANAVSVSIILIQALV